MFTKDISMVKEWLQPLFSADTLAMLAKREEARGYIRKHKELFRQIFPKAECPF